MHVKNRKKLLSQDLKKSTRDLRKLGLRALEKAIKAVKPKNLMKNSIKIENHLITIFGDKYFLDDFENIYIIGGGKATADMARYLLALLDKINYQNYRGVANIQEGLSLAKNFESDLFKLIRASHPLPNQKGVEGVKQMMKLIQISTPKDLIVCLISGGGSALLPMPRNGINLDDIKKVNSLLLESGASIHEINAIRKHLSAIKGGSLAKYVAQNSGAKLISLIISDVIGNDLDVIASGPTVPDSSTFKDALDVIRKYGLGNKIPKSVMDLLIEGDKKPELETPKKNDPCFQNVRNYLIGSIESSVKELKQFFKNKLFSVEYFSNEISGEAKKYGYKLYDLFKSQEKKILTSNNLKKFVLLGSGELTVTIKGDGIGGRNQEMLLSFIDLIKNKDLFIDFILIGANLDGIEGNSKAMGALVDKEIINKTNSLNLEPKSYLRVNDSNSFFKKVGGVIKTGPTVCIVNDLILLILKKSLNLQKDID